MNIDIPWLVIVVFSSVISILITPALLIWLVLELFCLFFTPLSAVGG
jgi:hypothetical protein